MTRYEAVSHTPSASHGCLTTVHLWPLTGRTHQLRRHLQALGFPILGDHQYGARLAPRAGAAGSAEGGAAGGAPTSTAAAEAGIEDNDDEDEDAVRGGYEDEGEQESEGDDAYIEQEGAGRVSRGALKRKAEAEPLGAPGGSIQEAGAAAAAAAPASAQAAPRISSEHQPVGGTSAEVPGTAGVEAAVADAGGASPPAVHQCVFRPTDGDGRLRFQAPVVLYLCAAELRFEHPYTRQPITVRIPEPWAFEEARQAAA